MSLFNRDEEKEQPLSTDYRAKEALEVPQEPTPAPQSSSGGKPVEEWAKVKHTENWAFMGAKFGNGWGQGKVLSEAEYDAAIERVCTMPINAG